MSEEFKEAEWNIAMGACMRLDGLLSRATELALREDARAWYKTLLRIFTEINSKLDNSEKDKIKKDLPILASEVKKLPSHRGITPELYQKLIDFELILREYIEKHKLGIPDKSDPGRAFEE